MERELYVLLILAAPWINPTGPPLRVMVKTRRSGCHGQDLPKAGAAMFVAMSVARENMPALRLSMAPCVGGEFHGRPVPRQSWSGQVHPDCCNHLSIARSLSLVVLFAQRFR